MSHKMEVDKTSYDEVTQMIAQMGQYSELEGKFKDLIDKNAFSRMIQYCRSTDMHEVIGDEQLDIFCQLPDDKSTVRISLLGKSNISSYCKTNQLPADVVVISKKQLKQVILSDLKVKIDLKDEVPLDEFAKQELISKLPQLNKGYRYKKRFSYEDKNVRYDFTILKTSSSQPTFLCHKGFVTSGVTNAKDTYEVEVEYIGTKQAVKKRGRLSKANVSDGASDFLHALVVMYMTFKGESHYVSAKMKDEALRSYIQLVFGSFDPKQLETAPRSYFAAPQPVTLERKHLYAPDLGVISILEKYTVTEKADGERALLYVHSDGKCFFIDSRLNIKYTGVKLNNLVNTLLDGELITRDVLGNKINMFGVFDVYFHNSQDVRGTPLVPNRVSIMQDISKRFKKKFEDDAGMHFFAKRFLHEGDILQNAKSILDGAAAFPYKIDGLIFTPANLGVGAVYENQPIPAVFGTWDRVFKYKPPEENTIDFLVKFGMPRAEGLSLKKELELYVGFNPQHWTRITPWDYINKNTKVREGYIEKRFEPSDNVNASSAFVDTDADRILRCQNGDEILDNTIVEFAWIDDAWAPMRVRYDKTELYRKQGISRTANDMKSAISIWRTILNPVTKEMITGHVKVPAPVIDDLDDDKYYFREIARDKMATKSMLDFHNYWIKNVCLIQKYKGKTLFDIACGKAGDLNKWVDAGYQKVLGIDYSRDNIENPMDGAYARTLKKFARRKYMPKYLYLTLDGGQVLNEQYFDMLKDENDKKIARGVWGYGKQDKLLGDFYGFVPKQGFDVVSCQFAIHYFFENDAKLSNFVKNVATNLTNGGYFIGTCLDSKRLEREFEQKGNELKGVNKDGRVIWNIRRIDQTQIDVYMESIGKRMREYLVDFDKLTSMFKKYDIELVSPITSFETEWRKLQNDKTVEQEIKDRILKMSVPEQDYSFMNVYFVFKKNTGT